MYRHVMCLFVFAIVLTGFSYEVRAQSGILDPKIKGIDWLLNKSVPLPKYVTTPPIFGVPSPLVRLGNDVEQARRASEKINPWTKRPRTKWTHEPYVKAYNFKSLGAAFVVFHTGSASNPGKIYSITVTVDRTTPLFKLSPKAVYESMKNTYERLLGKNGQKKTFNSGYWSYCDPVSKGYTRGGVTFGITCYVKIQQKVVYQVNVTYWSVRREAILILSWTP